MKGFAMLYVVFGVLSCVGARAIAYNSNTGESLSAEEWCECLNGTDLMIAKSRMTCLSKFKVFERFNHDVIGRLLYLNCTELILTKDATVSTTTTTNEKPVNSGSSVVLPTASAANNNVTLYPDVTTINDTKAESSEKAIAETEAGGYNHLYWSLPFIALLLAMLIGGILIYCCTRKSGYLQQPAKSTLQGDCSVLYCKMQV